MVTESMDRVMSAMLAQHPDVAAQATMRDLLTRLCENPWLGGFITYHHLEATRTVKAELCFSFEWGIQFESGNKRPPTYTDWSLGYFDRANAFAQALGVQLPYDKPENRLRLEYGGPF